MALPAAFLVGLPISDLGTGRLGLFPACPGRISTFRVALRIQMIGEQAPTVGGAGLQFDRTTERRDGFGHAPGLTARHPELEMHRSRNRLLHCERLEYLKRSEGAPGAAVRSAQDEAGLRKTGIHAQDLPRLFHGELGFFLEEPLRVRERDLDAGNWF